MSDVTKHTAEPEATSAAAAAEAGPLPRPAWQRFLFPAPNRAFLLRLALVAGLSYLYFGYLCIPTRIRGRSMEPTYRDGGFACCWRPRYWRRAPRRGEVVMVSLSGRRVMYFKRVVASAGDRVEFRAGQLWVNGRAVLEPYVLGPCTWDLPPRQVPEGHVYVIGDNRAMTMEEHAFGSVSLDRIEGGPLW